MMHGLQCLHTGRPVGSGRKVKITYADWQKFDNALEKIPDSNGLKSSLLWLGSITKDSVERLESGVISLESSVEDLRDTMNNRFDGLLGLSKGNSPRDSISAGFENLMYKRAKVIFPNRQILRNVLLTRPYLSKSGVVKNLQQGEIDLLLSDPTTIIEASLSLRASDLERIAKKKLELADMLAIDPHSIAAQYWILWLTQSRIGEELLLVDVLPQVFARKRAIHRARNNGDDPSEPESSDEQILNLDGE
uniref:Uncharacterized protein n=1 Tax=Ditylenchus dipsaci TaxID=166011 RepID=A0A915DCT4_9BILA